MVDTTTEAAEHEPSGDPSHAAYGQDYVWSCTCGTSAAFLAERDVAERRGEKHERYCPEDGTTTVEVAE